MFKVIHVPFIGTLSHLFVGISPLQFMAGGFVLSHRESLYPTRDDSFFKSFVGSCPLQMMLSGFLPLLFFNRVLQVCGSRFCFWKPSWPNDLHKRESYNRCIRTWRSRVLFKSHHIAKAKVVSIFPKGKPGLQSWITKSMQNRVGRASIWKSLILKKIQNFKRRLWVLSFCVLFKVLAKNC